MTGQALIVQGNALKLSLPDKSVNLIVTSPPYFGLRSYRDKGEHYVGQIGSEATPQEFLEALWTSMKECWRVLTDDGVCIVNLGDKRSESGGGNHSGILSHRSKTLPRASGVAGRGSPKRYNKNSFGRRRSKQFFPYRFAIGCEDGLADPEGIGWTMLQDLVWAKPNGLPESVADRPRDSHEYWFVMTKDPRPFAAIDEIREPYAEDTARRYAVGYAFDEKRPGAQLTKGVNYRDGDLYDENPLGKLPPSVWEIATEPLIVPGWAKDLLRLPEHFAAFPQEWPRRLILAYSPHKICVECGKGRVPYVEERYERAPGGTTGHQKDGDEPMGNDRGWSGRPVLQKRGVIRGYVCECCPYTDHKRDDPKHGGGGQRVSWSKSETEGVHSDAGRHDREPAKWREYHLEDWLPPETRPSVVLDPFGGTGTTAGVARELGRIGVSVDLSADYCRLARWRIFQSGHFKKTRERTAKERQGTLL